MPAKHRRRAGRGKRALVAALTVGLAASAAMVWTASDAAFSGLTKNTGDTWSAATVSIADDDGGTAAFAVTGAMPGDSGSKCITVTYTGGPAATVKLYATGLTGGLGPYLNMTIAQGTGGSFASCTGFTPAVSTSSTLSAFASTYSSFGTGFGAWTNATTGSTATYQISWSIAADNGAANTSAALTFTWEAQNN